MKIHYYQVGPVPEPFLTKVIGQIESQGWLVRFVVYRDVLKNRIVLPGQEETTARYMIVAVLQSDDEKNPRYPEIKP